MTEQNTDQQDSVSDIESEKAAYEVEFPPASVGSGETTFPLNRFHDVNVNVSVELGRVEMPIGEMLKLGEGAVVELTRNVSEEVDIMAQGVRIAKGEVVVVEDRYAVRITSIEDDQKL